MDFWKAVFLAQAFITIVYIFFGAFVSIVLCPQSTDLELMSIVVLYVLRTV